MQYDFNSETIVIRYWTINVLITKGYSTLNKSCTKNILLFNSLQPENKLYQENSHINSVTNDNTDII